MCHLENCDRGERVSSTLNTVETHLEIHDEPEGQLMEIFLSKDRHEEGILAAQTP